MLSDEHQVAEETLGEDAQIDLLTLASAAMLTIMCLLLSQILSEQTRVQSVDSLAEVHASESITVSINMVAFRPPSKLDRAIIDSFGNPFWSLPESVNVGFQSQPVKASPGDQITLENFSCLVSVPVSEQTPNNSLTFEKQAIRFRIDLDEVADSSKSVRVVFGMTSTLNNVPKRFVDLWNKYSALAEDSPGEHFERLRGVVSGTPVVEFETSTWHEESILPTLTIAERGSPEFQNTVASLKQKNEHSEEELRQLIGSLRLVQLSEVCALFPLIIVNLDDFQQEERVAHPTFWYALEVYSNGEVEDEVLGVQQKWKARILPASATLEGEAYVPK